MVEFWDGSGISWATCKQSAPRSRQITTPAPHHSIFTGRTVFLAPNQQCQGTFKSRESSIFVRSVCSKLLLNSRARLHAAVAALSSPQPSLVRYVRIVLLDIKGEIRNVSQSSHQQCTTDDHHTISCICVLPALPFGIRLDKSDGHSY